MRRGIPVALVVGLALAGPAPALGHSLMGRLESPLPLAVYLAGAAMTVALSFALVILRDVRADEPEVQPAAVPAALVIGLRAIGLIAWLWIVAQTVIGGSSNADVSGLFLWVFGWVGVAMVSAFVGPVWTWLDPFTTLYDLGAAMIRRAGVKPWEHAAYPGRLGTWPAVVGLASFVWLELVYRGDGLGVVLLAYTALTLAGMAQFGRDAWRSRGETFSVWFGTLNLLASVGGSATPEERIVYRRPFASGLLGPGWTTPSLVLVAIGVGSIMFDGLSQTKVWFDAFGLPSLAPATLELLGFLGIVIALALGVARLVGVAAVGAGLVPIAVGYLVAHYLTFLLGDGQRIIIAISDPLQLGWDLFGTAFYEPSTAWIPPGLVWTLQLAAVVGGHVIGAWAGHVVAVREAPPGVDVRWRQVPLAVLMVLLTTTTLWSLGQAVFTKPIQGGLASPYRVAIDLGRQSIASRGNVRVTSGPSPGDDKHETLEG